MSQVNILIVEDEVIVAENLSSKLEYLGYAVAGTALSGHEAVEMALKHRPQLILMDIKLQGDLDGIQAAEKIKNQHDIPVIYLTAHSDPNTLDRAKISKPYGYVLKPFDERDLATQIELALYKHESDRKIHEQREWLRVTLASIGDAVIATDAEGIITFLNPVAEALTGWPAFEAIGKPLGDVFRIINEYTRAPVDDPVRKVLMTGRIVGLANHTALICRDGKEVPIDDSGAPIQDEGGRILGVVLIFRDISETKKSEKAIYESEQRLRLFIEHAPAALAMFDRQMRYMSVSRRWLRDYNLGERNLVGLSHYQVFPEIPEHWKAVHQRAMKGEVVKVESDRFERADGSIQWLHWEVRPWRDQADNIGGIVVFSEDITEQRIAQEALQESHKRYRTLFEHSADGIFLHDLDGNIVDANRAAVAQSGYSKQELLQLNLFGLIPDPANKEDILRQWRQYNPDQPVIAEDLHRRKDGSVYPVEINTGRVQFDSQDLVLATVRDISKRKQSEKEREALQKQLTQAQKMESVGRLAGGVAHDFNNMLGVILGHTQLAMEQVDKLSSAHGDLAEVRKAAQRSADLTRQLLAFARQQTSSPKVLDLNQTIELMLTMIQRLIGEDIQLTFIPEESLSPVKIDPSQVDQILANLCVNSRDAIDGVGKITIETKNVVLDHEYCKQHAGCKPGNYVMLAVSDTGCGMKNDTLKNIFDPFFTTKKVGEGTGLGLATVYGIVKQNEGYIEVYSEFGYGTMFKIYLPQTQESFDKEAGNHTNEILKGTETVLLVEDEGSILNLANIVLQRYGYKVIAASTPKKALAMVQEYDARIHLLITDVVMPEMNGWELKEQLQKNIPEIKVLFMSGYTANIVAERGVLERNVEFLQKPFTVEFLAQKVREVLDREQ